ncbi:MAG TPA: DUF551 domain-containing protein [Candidatus Kapabacteria bacterium]|nr:DUF551 domain-containing protein [Candidatus Kapabacteria bacterium]
MSEKLKPCPFCGGEAQHAGLLAVCKKCGGAAWDADSWNRRAAPDAPAVQASICLALGLGDDASVDDALFAIGVLKDRANVPAVSAEPVMYRYKMACSAYPEGVWVDELCADMTLLETQALYTHPPAPAEAWQPIDTAPKDGSLFMAWRDHCTYPIVAQYVASHDWIEEYPSGNHLYHITHWMPLPTPPNGGES